MGLGREYAMKIRLKYTKQGQVKFVGHLDIIRLFQRAIKVARIPIAYSQGFNPHALVYFAMPLSVGVSSEAEYMDIVTQVDMTPCEVKEMLNHVLVEGIHITEAFLVEEDRTSLMSLVTAADYKMTLNKDDFKKLSIQTIKDQLNQAELMVQKKSKKGIKTINIKPMILECSVDETIETFIITLKSLAGSSENLGPQLFLNAILSEYNNGDHSDTQDRYVSITRQQLYAYDQGTYIALENYRRMV